MITETEKNRMREQLVSIALFAASFAVIGYFVPKILHQTIPADYYYRVSEIQVHNTGNIHPCGKIEYSFKRDSKISTDDGKSTTEIVRLFEDNQYSAFELSQRTGFQITPGSQTITHVKRIPCEVPYGIYFLSGTTSFDVDDARKTTYWQSDEFEITKGQNESTVSGEVNQSI